MRHLQRQEADNTRSSGRVNEMKTGRIRKKTDQREWQEVGDIKASGWGAGSTLGLL